MVYRYYRSVMSGRGILYCNYDKEPAAGAFPVLCSSTSGHNRNLLSVYFRKHRDTEGSQEK